jgi:hypothetical protein
LVFIADRLVSRGKVHNAQAPHPESDRARHIKSVVIRAAVCHDRTHLPDDVGVYSSVSSELDYTGDATHKILASLK